MKKERATTDRIKVTARRVRDRYKNIPEFRRLATFAALSLVVLTGVLVYDINKKDETSEPMASGNSLPDSEPEKSPPPQPDAEEPILPPLKAVTENSQPSRSAAVPAERLDLTNWKIALPIDTGHTGSPDEIKQTEIASFSLDPYFIANPDGEGVIFRAHAGGATTKNSKYPRSELREMTDGGRKEARWSSKNGAHVMTVRQAITHLPDKKAEIVAAQIHDDSDDIVMVRLEHDQLFVEADGKDIGILNPNYKLGTPYTITIVAEPGGIKVFYDGELKVNYDKSGEDYYFKAGCYTQTNTDRGDRSESYGEVIIYDLKVEHS